MASADWTFISDTLDASTVARNVVTSGVVAMPNGGGSFCYGMNSRVVATGVVALFTNLANFAPTTKGGKITGAIQRGVSGGLTGFAPFLFICLGGTSSADNCYQLGLGDSDASHIILRKGAPGLGLPDNAPGTNGVLRRSTDAVLLNAWTHLRLDAIKEPSGDVLLKCFMSNLGANAVTAPVWTAIPGMADFTDDSLGINTGSAPLTSGRMGFGMYVSDTARRCYFDQITADRQL